MKAKDMKRSSRESSDFKIKVRWDDDGCVSDHINTDTERAGHFPGRRQALGVEFQSSFLRDLGLASHRLLHLGRAASR